MACRFGPWFVDPDMRPGMAWNNHVIDARGNRVCFMAHSNGRDPDGDEAKAHLVAASPELKTALEDLLTEYERVAQFQAPTRPASADETIRAVLAALAKAEGR